MVGGRRFIMPADIEDGENIIEKLYNQLCISSALYNKHSLIPEIKFDRVHLEDIIGRETLPYEISEEEITLISMYCEEEINEMTSSHKNPTLPIPYIEDGEFFRYKDIADSLYKKVDWFLQLVDFFIFLSEKNISVSDNIEPIDFLYSSSAKIEYFVGFNNLSFANHRGESLFRHNLEILALLVNKYYLEDTENYQARLYQQKWFEKIEGRLIEPLLYNQYSSAAYNNFSEIKDDINDDKVFKKDKKNIGVFIDAANIMTPMFTGYSRMEIDFSRLSERVFGRREARNIKKKIAVIFLPDYQGEGDKDDKYQLIFSIKEYLESYGFEIITVENKTAAAKINVNGKISDTDDIRLIAEMEQTINELDSILLMTGDKHFIEIAHRYKNRGKIVKIISVSEENSSKDLIDEFDHHYIYEYPDCINFV